MLSLKTYNDEKYIYSVDMMLTYVNTHKLPIEKVNLQENLWQIQQNVWGEYSPSDVLQHPEKKKYAENIQRIHQADLSYPILMTSKYQIIDGYHRFLKAMQKGETTIKAYILEPSILRKCILRKDLNYKKLHETTEIHDVLEIYVRRFCQ